MKSVVLAPGREKSLRRHHPWVFSGAIARVDGSPAPGETVVVRGARGEFLAYGAYSPRSQIRVRVLGFDQAAGIDAAFIADRVRAALAYRAEVLPATDAQRLIHGESDGLPGVIVDRYATTAVLQCTSTAAEHWRDAVAAAVVEQAGCTTVYERSDADVRALEGLAPRVGVCHGDEPADAIAIHEGAACYLVDVRHGQKTGFYLDQRDNRAAVARAAQGCDVLDVFCYTGGFAVAALAGGARHVTGLDSSSEALSRAQANAAASGIDQERVEWLTEDAFAGLRRLYDQGRRFDRVVLDPPKFAPSHKHVQRAARAYKDVNLWALRLLRPGGQLFTFSCSSAVDGPLFQSIVAGAAVDAGVDGRIVSHLQAAADHPTALAFPEGTYLKGLIVMRS